MANAWREHVKKTMNEMKAASNSGKVMLKDVLKAAGKTYKKSGDNKKTQKKRTTKRKTTKKKKTVKRRRSGTRKR
jgi:hypothetical protein